jgi:eukaryotic-like serine/threonine-protein kinase
LKITGPQWKQLFGLLDTVLDLPPAQRPALLARVAGEDPELGDKLRQLLEENVDWDAAIPPAAPILGDMDASALRAGTQVGPYTLIRELGEGGMSTVWLAARSDGQVRRPLALKLPHVFMRTARLAERFEREREILESLSHPNIARLYDAGVTIDGQPYLGMEYVEGVSLVDYSNDSRRNVRERLQTFLQVLDAVRYAHSRLVIHRDLKPSNILVTAEHQVCLLDFGIAKLTVDGAARETELTRRDGRALTPDYASPEQIAGQPLSTSSDVYSLGVVLFELLTGQRPYKLKRDSRGALEDAILGAEPSRLHESVLPDQAMRCGLGNAELKAELRGDLEAIVFKSLKKSPLDRYGTADSFAQDIERYLRDETVFARADSAFYRTTKFLRRNRLLVGVALAVVLALSAGLGAALWQAKVARTEAHTAEAVQNFLENLFRANSANQADPIKARQVTARELLDLGSAQIDAALSDAPEAKLRVLKTLASMYDELGLTDKLLVLSRKRVDLARSLPGNHDRALTETLVELGNSAEREDLREEAGRAFAEAEAILDKMGDETSQERAELESSIAYYYDDFDAAKALPHAERGVRAWASLPKSVDLANSVHLVNALSGMAMISIDAAKFGSAKSAAAEALVLADSLGAIANGERRQVFEALGYANWGLGDPAAAEEDLRRAAQIAAAGTADVILDKLETSGPLADFLIDTGRVGEGLAILQDELPDVESLRGARAASIRPARTWLRYGRALVMYGRLEEGMAILQNALDRQPDFIPTAEFTAELLDAKASGSMDMGRYAEAERLIADAAAAHKQIGEFFTIYENPNVTLRTRWLMDMGRIDEASTAFRAYMTGAPDAGELSRSRVEPIIVRAELSLTQGAAAAAKDLAGQVLNLVARSNGRKYLTGWEMQASLVSGKADLLAGRPNEALPLLARALELGREHYDPGRSLRYADAQIAMAECMLDLGRSVEGRELFVKAAANHATHTELAERYREPLQRLRARITVSPRRLQ